MTGDEFQRSGLLYLANRTLHPFGVALAVTIDEGGSVRDELILVATDDPSGFTFDDQTEAESRHRLAEWLREHWHP